MADVHLDTKPPKRASRYLSHLPAVLGVVLLVGAIYVVQKEFRHLKLHDISEALRAIPRASLIFAFVWTILSYFILTFYDRLGTIYAGHKVSYGKVAFASFCAYALAHNLGFAAVSGAAVRYRLYAHWGLTPLQIGKTVAFCSLTFGLGGLVLGGAILFTEPTTIPFFGQWLPVWALHAVGALLWAIVLGYVTLSKVMGSFRVRGHMIDLPKWRMALVQVALATVDVAVTATIFFSLLPDAQDLTWTIFLGVYVASYTAGLAANLPGGIGVFDTAMLFGLEPYIDAPHIVGAIVVFRLYYYVIPLFLAGSLFAGNEILLRGGGVLRAVGVSAGGAAPGGSRCRAVERAGFRRRRRHRTRRPLRRDVADAGRAGAEHGLLLAGSGVRRDRLAGWAIRAVADRRRAGDHGVGAVAQGQPRMGADHPAVDHGRGVRGDAGQSALGRRGAGAERGAAGTVPVVLLPSRVAVERAVRGGDGDLADRAGDLPAGAGSRPAPDGPVKQ